MKNIKDKVYEALLTVSKHVSDSYPGTWAEDATIQYVDEQNNVYEASSSENGLQSTTTLAVDEAMKKTGLKRTECADILDPSGMKHKQMRYEGIIAMDSEEVYWT